MEWRQQAARTKSGECWKEGGARAGSMFPVSIGMDPVPWLLYGTQEFRRGLKAGRGNGERASLGGITESVSRSPCRATPRALATPRVNAAGR